MFKRNGFWVRRRKGKIIAIVHANNYNDSLYNFDTEEFDPCDHPVTELGMSDEWDKVDEKELLEELGKEAW
jgi:hypothetical protein